MFIMVFIIEVVLLTRESIQTLIPMHLEELEIETKLARSILG